MKRTIKLLGLLALLFVSNISIAQERNLEKDLASGKVFMLTETKEHIFFFEKMERTEKGAKIILFERKRNKEGDFVVYITESMVTPDKKMLATKTTLYDADMNVLDEVEVDEPMISIIKPNTFGERIYKELYQ